MCLLIAISHIVADSPLIVGANRDEFYHRDAVAATVLQAAMGSWLALPTNPLPVGVI
ncbi:MAG: NRDE family protein [Acidimicrobiales bacterium]